MTRDAVVIGAGPAGAIAARLLAERATTSSSSKSMTVVGTPVHCTGLLGAEAFDEFDLPRRLILARAGAARFWGAPGSRSRSGATASPPSSSIARARSASVAGRAERPAPRSSRGARAESDRRRIDDGVVDRHARGTRRRCARGLCARVRRELPVSPAARPGRARRASCRARSSRRRFPMMPEIEVRFGREVAPSGFAWMVPFRRDGVPHARIGLMSETRSARALRGVCRRRSASAPASIRLRSPTPRQKMLPLGPVAPDVRRRVLAVGDAAGLVKPTTGGGIYYGLLSGALAARGRSATALREDRLGRPPPAALRDALAPRLGQEIRVGLAFRRIAARLSDESIDALIELARVDGVVPLLQENASFNWHRKAAMALLAHPAFRSIVFKSWTRSAGPI